MSNGDTCAGEGKCNERSGGVPGRMLAQSFYAVFRRLIGEISVKKNPTKRECTGHKLPAGRGGGNREAKAGIETSSIRFPVVSQP